MPLGPDSLVSIFEHREKSIYRDNLFEDGGPFQLYGGMYHCVVANNTAVRTDGFIAEGLQHGKVAKPAFMPVAFVEHLDNTIAEGNNYGGGVGGFTLSGFYNASSVDYTGAMATAITYRGNTADNGFWTVEGAVEDVLIEGNTMVDSDAGLVMKGNQTFRVFTRNNVGL